MEKREYLPGALLSETGQTLPGLMLIAEGKVRADYQGGELLLKIGDVAGLSEVYSRTSAMTYIAAEKVTVALYPFQDDGLMTILKRHPEVSGYFASSVFRQFQDIAGHYKKLKADSMYLYRFLIRHYQRYEKFCTQFRISPRTLPGQEEIVPLMIAEDIEPWLGGFYQGIYGMIGDSGEASRPETEFFCGLMVNISRDIGNILAVNKIVAEYRDQLLAFFMNEQRMDLFEIFSAFYFHSFHLSGQEKPDPAFIEEMINLLRGYGFEEKDYFIRRVKEYQDKLQEAEQVKPPLKEETATISQKAADLHDSVSVILNYADCPPEDADAFQKLLSLYKQTVNKNSVEDEDRKQRLALSKLFYRIYAKALQLSFMGKEIPDIVRMFFLFGYVDEELAGMENAVILHDISRHLPTDPKNGIYSAYEWLKAIYEGKKEPCRNEFDRDYQDYVHELKRGNKISQAEATAMLSDTLRKVEYELENVFPTVNRVTFGRISTFCPVFSEHNVLKSPDKLLVSADMVKQALQHIRERDFGAFCRESIFSMPEKGIGREYINTEILPDMILLPNIGSRGIMWQEIEGKRRSTPARFMCSLLQVEDMPVILTKMTGEFRWEMCKRIQGARWNDVTERSLTSEYSDYLASFKKNTELSVEAKEKIKNDLIRYKNNTKEMFVHDYITWIMYESNGAPRLNKTLRSIFFTYCPFTAAVREKLRTNPLYTDVLDKYEIRLKQKSRHMDGVFQKFRGGGSEVPQELKETRRIMEL